MYVNKAVALGSFKQFNWPLLFLLVAFLLLRSQFWTFAPIWDAHWNYQAILEANSQSFDILNYSVSGHISQGVLLAMSVPGRIFGENYFIFNVVLTILESFIVFAFYRLLLLMTKAKAPSWEAASLAALFAFHPSIIANMIHFNFDLGILGFGLWYWLMLMEGRPGAAGAFAVLFMFSKETSLLLLPLPFLFCWIMQAPDRRKIWFRRNFLAVVVPYIAFACFVLFKTQIREERAVWRPDEETSPLSMVVHYFDDNGKLIEFIGMMFIINFNWLLTGIVAVLLTKASIWSHEGEHTPENRRPILFCSIILAIAFVLTLVRPVTNVRYVMFLVPVVLLAFSYLLLREVKMKQLRWLTTILLLGLFIGEDFRTIDPISKWFFGTFQFGVHPILQMTKRTREFAGYGRDQLVYNLEFLYIPELLDEIMQDLDKGGGCVVCHPFANWRMFPETSRRDWKIQFEPQHRIKTASDLVKHLPLPLRTDYIAFPNFNNKKEIGVLLGAYHASATTNIYELNGYAMEVLHFRRSD